MGKNIVMCADSTGNLGGYTPDSNVYRIYKAIDLHNRDPRQIAFYDHGVGTSSNRYWRALSGAFGFGFKRNICDLYKFLAQNYSPEENDKVFFFGFGRGAAQVRACSGFIAACGLIDGRGVEDEELEDRIQAAFKSYQSGRPAPPVKSHGVIPITFIGVWDTVSALGFPQNWNITSIGMWVLNALFKALDYGSDFIFPHRFYNYELTDSVQHAYHALAIDDERHSFSPLLWTEPETDTTPQVEQVWFAGAHGNVGGGYRRTGLSSVALDWMLVRAGHHGLRFQPDVRDEVYRDTNPHGRLYNSRDGLSIYYRYNPRNLETLSAGKVRKPIKIHRSVIERMTRHSGNYAPGNVPGRFDIVETPLESAVQTVETGANKTEVNKWVFRRKWLYGLFLEFTLLILIAAGWFWLYPPSSSEQSPPGAPTRPLDWLMGTLADVLDSILPDFFEGLVTFAIRQHPIYFGLAVLCLLIFGAAQRFFRRETVRSSEAIRQIVLRAVSPAATPEPPDRPSETDADTRGKVTLSEPHPRASGLS